MGSVTWLRLLTEERTESLSAQSTLHPSNPAPLSLQRDLPKAKTSPVIRGSLCLPAFHGIWGLCWC